MKLSVKTLINQLLAGVFVLAAVSGAGAEDLLAPPSPEFGRACGESGAGFVPLTGTETCVRVGGRVRADTGIVGGRSANSAPRVRSRATGAAIMETRTQTDLGLVRTYMEVEVPVRAGQ